MQAKTLTFVETFFFRVKISQLRTSISKKKKKTQQPNSDRRKNCEKKQYLGVMARG